MLDKLKGYSSLFFDTETSLERENVFSFRDEGSGLVLCAPHSTKSFACKRIKMQDLYTGELVRFLGEECQVSTIVRTKFVPFKVLVSDFVEEKGLLDKLFIDVHGMTNDRSFDLAVGTGIKEPELYDGALHVVSVLARKYNIKMVVNHPNYSGCAGLTGRLQKKHERCTSLQLEWRRDFRDFYNCPQIVEKQTIPFMKELVLYFKDSQSFVLTKRG